MSIKRGKQSDAESPSRWVSFLPAVHAARHLHEAIGLLEPLVTLEANPEYRYLLARCYLGLSDGRGKYINLALEQLGLLVEQQPEIADYQYEYASAKMLRANSTLDGDVKRNELREAIELLESICSSNPNVASYQVARSLAMQEFATSLDQSATQLDTINALLSFSERVKASEVANRAYQSYYDSQESIGESYTSRIPENHLVALGESILANVPENDCELAKQIFRDALDQATLYDFDLDIVNRARFGLAKSLSRSYQLQPAYERSVDTSQAVEAVELLEQLGAELRAMVEEDLSSASRGPTRPQADLRAFGRLSFLCKTEYEHEILIDGSEAALASIEKTVDDYRRRRFKQTVPDQALQTAFDLILADLYLDLGHIDQGFELRDRSLTALKSRFDSETKLVNRLVHGRVNELLLNHYRKKGDEEMVQELQQIPAARPSAPGS